MCTVAELEVAKKIEEAQQAIEAARKTPCNCYICGGYDEIDVNKRLAVCSRDAAISKAKRNFEDLLKQNSL